HRECHRLAQGGRLPGSGQRHHLRAASGGDDPRARSGDRDGARERYKGRRPGDARRGHGRLGSLPRCPARDRLRWLVRAGDTSRRRSAGQRQAPARIYAPLAGELKEVAMASDHVAGAPADRPELAATVHIETRRELGRADRKIYGHFLEGHFFGNIHGGVFDEGSPLAIDEPGPAAGLRRDVIEVCRALGVPVVRWPGGNYASAYHWEDGIGPREARPRRLELTWGGREGQPREEDNRFGTDEFLAWCALAGAEPYLNNNARSVEEAVRWVEYTNYAGDTHYTRLRAANGHPEPYGVRYWGLGNEVYGAWQMGHRSAEQYAADARE